MATKTAQLARWTTEDFIVVGAFLRDILVALADENLLLECRNLLEHEGREASRRMQRITEAIGACD